MALLALTLALLSIPVATVATQVVSLDMSPLSFDDQYQGCEIRMNGALAALNRFEFQKNFVFAYVWPRAVAKWQRRGSPVSPLSDRMQAIAIMAYTIKNPREMSLKGTKDLYKEFNSQVRVAGSSPQQYRDYFHFKALHFLLTKALATLRVAQGQRCRWVYRGVDIMFTARVGDIVRFGQFTSTSLYKSPTQAFGDSTVFRVWTCYGASIEAFSESPHEKEVLIPPFEKFKVTSVIQRGGKAQIQLISVGTHSNYNCEWLRGGDRLGTALGQLWRQVELASGAPSHLGGLVLATTALAVAIGVL